MKRLFIVLALLVTSFFCFGEEDFYKYVQIGDIFDTQTYKNYTTNDKYQFILSEFYSNDKSSITLKFTVIVHDLTNNLKYQIPLTYKVKLNEVFTIGLYDVDRGNEFIINKIEDNNEIRVKKIEY